MTPRDSDTRAGSGDSSPSTAGERLVEHRPLSWLLRQKVAVPERATGYFDRAALVGRAMPTRRRLTVLMTPGGFGKTTLLAECCRRLRDDGVPVAWVSVNEQDEAAVVDTYIAYACRRAASHASTGAEPLDIAAHWQADRGAGGRTALDLREIATRDGPFVLVFDEAERLGNPRTTRARGALQVGKSLGTGFDGRARRTVSTSSGFDGAALQSYGLKISVCLPSRDFPVSTMSMRTPSALNTRVTWVVSVLVRPVKNPTYGMNESPLTPQETL